MTPARLLARSVRIAAVASVLTGAFACGPASTDGTDTSGNDGGGAFPDISAFAAYRQPCVDRINGFRATLSLAPLARWGEEEGCADNQAMNDATSGTAHTNFGACTEHAQNTCPGWASADAVVSDCLEQMWNEGPGSDFQAHGHYINMSSTSYTKVACSFYAMQNGKVWASQDFR